ncbi:type II toxin-antitoxin system RelE/ParE family toxin [Steroidobacter cummioxidans]|uniref:type II toxin-antitoxin system RelE/ParE family toxin n=1 Tax=Steroidobacter cummioxidans TaxID=1803913 RepID=UPI00137A2209|nr:type II toxin-antitoxin system RelE/ParE family toxin [Steroidobacter cummioxidans]
MAKYELARAADRDLDDIYAYTFRQFGPLQADVYFESLEECLNKLAENPLLGIDASNVRTGYRRFVHQRHTLYYKKIKAGVRIVRVLGPGMSVERSLGRP